MTTMWLIAPWLPTQYFSTGENHNRTLSLSATGTAKTRSGTIIRRTKLQRDLTPRHRYVRFQAAKRPANPCHQRDECRVSTRTTRRCGLSRGVSIRTGDAVLWPPPTSCRRRRCETEWSPGPAPNEMIWYFASILEIKKTNKLYSIWITAVHPSSLSRFLNLLKIHQETQKL